MATSYKNIVITPNISNTSDPMIQFSGANSSVNTDITMYVYPASNGTLSFEGSAGQLFSITNDLSNSLFAVSDVSGIPSIEVFANGLVSLIPISGNVVFGNTTTGIIANTTGAYVSSNSTVNATHTAALLQVSNSSSTANLTAADLKIGATTVVNSTQITTTLLSGNVSGSYANITGQVNTATLYATTSANVGGNVQLTTSNLLIGNSTANSTQTSTYIQVASLSGTSNLTSIQLSVGANVTVNTTTIDVGNTTFTTTNAVFGGTIAANGGIGTATQVLTSGGAGNAYWSAISSSSGTVTSISPGNGVVSSTGGAITASGTLYVDGANGVSVDASGVNVLAQTPLVSNATGLWLSTSAGSGTYSSGISAITVDSYGRVTSVTGSAGYVTSSGVTSISPGNGVISSTGGAITGTGTLYLDPGTGTVVNTTGVHVNATYIGTIAPTLTGTGASGSWGISVTGSAATFTSTSQDSRFNSIGVGTAAAPGGGAISASGNITAYVSDKRLKKNIKIIINALEKVKLISGVTFTFNDVAAKYGYTDQRLQAGVLAQEIESVLPEVVVPAPFDVERDKNGNVYSKSGENYKTVQYEKIIPLLIEAIKELSDKVENLQNEIEELKKE